MVASRRRKGRSLKFNSLLSLFPPVRKGARLCLADEFGPIPVSSSGAARFLIPPVRSFSRKERPAPSCPAFQEGIFIRERVPRQDCSCDKQVTSGARLRGSAWQARALLRFEEPDKAQLLRLLPGQKPEAR